MRSADMLPDSAEDMASPEVTEAWDRELARRIAARRADETGTYDLEDVLARARLLTP